MNFDKSREIFKIPSPFFDYPHRQLVSIVNNFFDLTAVVYGYLDAYLWIDIDTTHIILSFAP